MNTETTYAVTIIFTTPKPLREFQLGDLAGAAYTQILEPGEDYDDDLGEDVTPDTRNVRVSYSEVF
jgi:hypothetical protein